MLALVPSDGPGAIGEALERLRDLQTALRLYAPGISLAPLAWIRARRASWRALPIPGGGRGDGAVVIAADQEDELRAFANLVARRRPAEGELAWALERFELAVERDDRSTGLTRQPARPARPARAGGTAQRPAGRADRRAVRAARRTAARPPSEWPMRSRSSDR